MWDALTEIDQDTKGWRSREVEGTGGHSSVLLDRRLVQWLDSSDTGEDGIVLLFTTLSKPFADDSNKNMSPFLIHDCKWPTTVSLEVKHNAADMKLYFGLITHLARSFRSTPCTHNQVFVHTFGLVHSLCTVAGLDDGNHCLLQLVCGGLLDSSVSPA